MELYYYMCSTGYEPSEFIKELPLSELDVKFYYISNIKLPITTTTYDRLHNWKASYSYNVEVLVKCMITNHSPDYMHLSLEESEDGESWIEFFKHFCQALIDYDQDKILPKFIAYDENKFPINSVGNNNKGYFHGTIIELCKN